MSLLLHLGTRAMDRQDYRIAMIRVGEGGCGGGQVSMENPVGRGFVIFRRSVRTCAKPV